MESLIHWVMSITVHIPIEVNIICPWSMSITDSYILDGWNRILSYPAGCKPAVSNLFLLCTRRTRSRIYQNTYHFLRKIDIIFNKPHAIKISPTL